MGYMEVWYTLYNVISILCNSYTQGRWYSKMVTLHVAIYLANRMVLKKYNDGSFAISSLKSCVDVCVPYLFIRGM